MSVTAHRIFQLAHEKQMREMGLWPKSERERFENACVHFTGVSDLRCKSGVRYKDVRDGDGIACLKCGNFGAPGAHIPCPSRRWPNAHEADEYALKRKIFFRRMRRKGRMWYALFKRLVRETRDPCVVELRCPFGGGAAHFERTATRVALISRGSSFYQSVADPARSRH